MGPHPWVCRIIAYGYKDWLAWTHLIITQNYIRREILSGRKISRKR